MKKLLALIVLISPALFSQSIALRGAGLTAGGGAGNTFTLVRHSTSVAGACSGGTGAQCSITTTVGAGNVGVIFVQDATGAQHSLTSLSGGGSWTVPAASACDQFNAAEGGIGCAYTLSTTTDTAITVTLASAAFSDVSIVYYEYSVSPGPAVLDVAGKVHNAGSSTSQAGVTLTLTGTSDIILQSIIISSGNVSSVASPFGNILNSNSFTATADRQNTSAGTAPTFTLASSRTAGFSAIAIK